MLSSLFPVSHSTCGEKAGWRHPPSETSTREGLLLGHGGDGTSCSRGWENRQGCRGYGIWGGGGSPWLGSHSFAHGAPQKVVVMPGCPGEALRSRWEQRQDFICHQLYSNPGFCLRNPRQSLPDPVTGGSAIPSPGQYPTRRGRRPRAPTLHPGLLTPLRTPPAPRHQGFTCVQLRLPTPRKRASLLSARSLPRNGGRGTRSCRSPLALAKFIPSGGGSSFTAGTAWLR